MVILEVLLAIFYIEIIFIVYNVTVIIIGYREGRRLQKLSIRGGGQTHRAHVTSEGTRRLHQTLGLLPPGRAHYV